MRITNPLLALEVCGAVLMLAVAVVFALLLARVHTISVAQNQLLTRIGLLLALALWAGSCVLLAVTAYDLRGAHTPAERAVAWRFLVGALYRCVAKGLIAGFFVLLDRARTPNVAHFLQKHPFTGAAIILLMLIAFSVNEFIEPAWRLLFRRRYGRAL